MNEKVEKFLDEHMTEIAFGIVGVSGLIIGGYFGIHYMSYNKWIENSIKYAKKIVFYEDPLKKGIMQIMVGLPEKEDCIVYPVTKEIFIKAAENLKGGTI